MSEPTGKKLPSPQERMELILLGLVREQGVQDLCKQAGVSKPLFYRWMGQAREGLRKALEAKRPGRKPKEPQASPEQVEKMREDLKRMEKEMAALRKERDRLERITEVAQGIIRHNAWGPTPEKAKRRGRPPKKKDGQMPPESNTSSAGRPEEGASAAGTSPRPGASAKTPIGDGSTESSKAPPSEGCV